MEDWYKEFQRSLREEERNQELKRQNDLLDQQSWKQQAALEENNRIAREQQQALEERNRLERQRQWEEESRYQRELEQRQEQVFKDRIFELKKLWASSQTDDERGRVQILLAEAEADYQAYLQEKAAEEERKRLKQEEVQKRLEQERRQIEEEQKFRNIRNAVLGILFVLVLIALGTGWLLSGNHSVTVRKGNNKDAQSSSTLASPSSTIRSSLGSKTSQTVSSSVTSTSKPTEERRFYFENYVGRNSSDVVAELEGKKVPANLIKIEEEESNEVTEGMILKQTPAAGSTYDLTKAATITLTVAKKVTSVNMPSYIGSSFEFTKNNLVQIVGVKEANIEEVDVATAPAGTAEGAVVDQSPKAGEKVDLARTRVRISVYKPRNSYPIDQSTTTTRRRE